MSSNVTRLNKEAVARARWAREWTYEDPKGDFVEAVRLIRVQGRDYLSLLERLEIQSEVSLQHEASAARLESEAQELLRVLRAAEAAARVQELAGNEGDADAIRRDAIRRVLELAAAHNTGTRDDS